MQAGHDSFQTFLWRFIGLAHSHTVTFLLHFRKALVETNHEGIVGWWRWRTISDIISDIRGYFISDTRGSFKCGLICGFGIVHGFESLFGGLCLRWFRSLFGGLTVEVAVSVSAPLLTVFSAFHPALGEVGVSARALFHVLHRALHT